MLLHVQQMYVGYNHLQMYKNLHEKWLIKKKSIDINAKGNINFTLTCK